MRICPECENRTLDITEVPDKYICWTCGSKWQCIIHADNIKMEGMEKDESSNV